MKIRPSSVAVTVAVAIPLAVWIRGFWFTEVFATHRSNETNRTSLLQVREAVPIGAEYSDVLAAYWRHRSRDLRLHANDPGRWIVHMPVEFGAGDWRLGFEFDGGKVSAVKVTTSDGGPPKDGPPDKQP